jgi:hypothetical protein
VEHPMNFSLWARLDKPTSYFADPTEEENLAPLFLVPEILVFYLDFSQHLCFVVVQTMNSKCFLNTLKRWIIKLSRFDFYILYIHHSFHSIFFL